MRIDVLSLFPDYFKGPLDESILKRAQEKGLLDINLVDIRAYSKDKHKKVDDRPYGGGPGMVMMADPVVSCVRDCKGKDAKVIYMSPQGKQLTHAKCRELAKLDHLILLAGHYEGIDERAIECVVDEEIRIGDFVLTNGCLAACVVIDALCRFIPGVIGDDQGPVEDSFESGLLDWPHYTKPLDFEGRAVPEVLLSGHHENIARWRIEAAKARTKEKRFDLYLNWLEKRDQEKQVQLDAVLPCILEAVSVNATGCEEAKRFYKRVFGRCFHDSDGHLQVEMRDDKLLVIADENSVTITCDIESFISLKRRVKQQTALVSDEMTEQNQRFSFRDPAGNLLVIKHKS